jgi:hypothetical protein
MQPPRSLHNNVFGYPDGIKNIELPIEGLTGSVEVKGIKLMEVAIFMKSSAVYQNQKL